MIYRSFLRDFESVANRCILLKTVVRYVTVAIVLYVIFLLVSMAMNIIGLIIMHLLWTLCPVA